MGERGFDLAESRERSRQGRGFDTRLVHEGGSMNGSDEFDRFDGIEEEVAPTRKLSVWLLLSDFFSNLGTIIENIATIPNDISLRIQGHVKWRQSRELSREEAARTIEQIEEFANENRSH